MKKKHSLLREYLSGKQGPKDVLRCPARPDRAALLAETKCILNMTPPGPQEDSVLLLREDRDSR